MKHSIGKNRGSPPRVLAHPWQIACIPQQDDDESDLPVIKQCPSSDVLNSCTETDYESESESSRCLSERRRLKWSDEESGGKLAEVFTFSSNEVLNDVRLIFLMVNVQDQMFEAIHCELETSKKVRVKDILEQLPLLSVLFQDEKFTSLVRESSPRGELLNSTTIQNYTLVDGEILVAVARGAHPIMEGLKFASRLLKSNKKVLRKTIRKARISGKALQSLYSTEEWTLCKKKLRKKALKREKKAVSSESITGGFLTRKFLQEFCENSNDVSNQMVQSTSPKQHCREANVCSSVDWYRTKSKEAQEYVTDLCENVEVFYGKHYDNQSPQDLWIAFNAINESENFLTIFANAQQSLPFHISLPC